MIINHDFGAFNSIASLYKNRTSAIDQPLGLVLYVGLADDDVDAQSKSSSMSAATFMAMDITSFERLSPRLILTPMVAGNQDVLDFAQKLQSLSFKGRYRAVVQKLPDARMIVDEVKAMAPDVNFAVTELV